MSFDITHNFDPFTDAMKKAEPILREEMLRATDRLTLKGESLAKVLAPVGRTGHLRRSIAAKPAVWAGGASGEYGTATPYAKYVEEGRGPVVPVNKKVLRFVIGGRAIFTRYSQPARGHWFMRASLNALRPLVPREYGAAMDRVIARIGGA